MLNRIAVSLLVLLLMIAAGCAGDRPSTQPGQPQAKSSPRDDFPFTVAFEQGAKQFEPGDQITITDVRGTSNDMQGGIYRISGTYTLLSHDEATLAASVTARDFADGIGNWNKAQTTTITKGHGSFTLLLPVSVRGWPHVSFYGKTSEFGGIYVGTGDSVLCSTVPEPKPTDLHSQVGHEVSFQTQFDDAWKEANGVMFQGEQVYLIRPVFAEDRRPDIGSRIQVQGVLRYRPSSSNGDPTRQSAPACFYIDRALVRVLPPTSG